MENIDNIIPYSNWYELVKCLRKESFMKTRLIFFLLFLLSDSSSLLPKMEYDDAWKAKLKGIESNELEKRIEFLCDSLKTPYHDDGIEVIALFNEALDNEIVLSDHILHILHQKAKLLVHQLISQHEGTFQEDNFSERFFGPKEYYFDGMTEDETKILHGCRSIAKFIFSKKIMSLEGEDLSRAFIKAAEKGYTSIIKKLINRPDININLRNKKGHTAYEILVDIQYHQANRKHAKLILLKNASDQNISYEDLRHSFFFALKHCYGKVILSFLKRNDLKKEMLDEALELDEISLMGEYMERIPLLPPKPPRERFYRVVTRPVKVNTIPLPWKTYYEDVTVEITKQEYEKLRYYSNEKVIREECIDEHAGLREGRNLHRFDPKTFTYVNYSTDELQEKFEKKRKEIIKSIEEKLQTLENE